MESRERDRKRNKNKECGTVFKKVLARLEGEGYGKNKSSVKTGKRSRKFQKVKKN